MISAAYIFGKAAELHRYDVEKGQARFGGLFRPPIYLQAYAESAEVLFEHASGAERLDELAQPLLYLHRHILELALKKLLRLLLDLRVENRRWYELMGEGHQIDPPSCKDYKVMRSDHDLSKLRVRVEDSLNKLGYPTLPQEFRQAEELIHNIERRDPSRFRYPYVNIKKRVEEAPSYPEESTVQIRSIHELVRKVVDVHCRFPQIATVDTSKYSLLEYIDTESEGMDQVRLQHFSKLADETTAGKLPWIRCTHPKLRTKDPYHFLQSYEIVTDEFLRADFLGRNIVIISLWDSSGTDQNAFALARLTNETTIEWPTLIEDHEINVVREAARVAGCVAVK